MANAHGITAMDLQKRLLDQVLGARDVAGLPHEEAVEPRSQGIVELPERRVVAGGVALHGMVGG
jgi:hypothetical protein